MNTVAHVSIVMAVYNGEKYLEKQIASILQQLLPLDEIIIIDDNSTDNSWKIITSIHDERIIKHKNFENIGVRLTFQRGISSAKYEIIFLSDQDDIWHKNKRELFMEKFLSPNVTVVISDAQTIDAEDKIMHKSFMKLRGGFKPGFWSNFYKNKYLGCAMAIRKCVADVALPIPWYMPMHDMWLGLIGCLIGKVEYISVPLTYYRRHGNNVSSLSRSESKQIIVWRLNLLRGIVTRMPKLVSHKLSKNNKL